MHIVLSTSVYTMYTFLDTGNIRVMGTLWSHSARIREVLLYINLSIQNYAQTIVECLPLFACTEKSVLLRSGPVLSHITTPVVINVAKEIAQYSVCLQVK